jgi:hypothetical protein
MFFLDKNSSADRTYTNVDLYIWTLVEPGSYFLAACMPSLKPLKRKTLEVVGLSGIITSKLDSVASSKRFWKGSKAARLESRNSSVNGIRLTHSIRQHVSTPASSTQDLGHDVTGGLEMDQYLKQQSERC